MSFRITPASAGKTFIKWNIRLYSWDHPRECGKNWYDLMKVQKMLGSPPRVREKHDQTLFLVRWVGITPASAGKTLKDPIEIANPD